MHELSIAQNIIEIVNDTFTKAKAKKVNGIEIEIGNFSGVELDALEFALEISLKETQFENADVDIISVEGKGRCKNCNNEFVLKSLYNDCPECKSAAIEVLSGKELRVKSINVD